MYEPAARSDTVNTALPLTMFTVWASLPAIVTVTVPLILLSALITTVASLP